MVWNELQKNPNRRIEKCNKRLKSISVDKMTASLGIANNLLMIGVVFQSTHQSVVLFKSNTKTLLYDFHISLSYKTEFKIAFSSWCHIHKLPTIVLRFLIRTGCVGNGIVVGMERRNWGDDLKCWLCQLHTLSSKYL